MSDEHPLNSAIDLPRHLAQIEHLRRAIKAMVNDGERLAFTGRDWARFHDALIVAEEAIRFLQTCTSEEFLVAQVFVEAPVLA